MIKTEGLKRIINLSSHGHTFQKKKIDYDNFHFTKEGTYEPMASYAQSKYCNVLFTMELQKRLNQDFKDQFLVVAIHPGVIATELVRDVPYYQQVLFTTLGYAFLKSIGQGAATTIYACVTKELKGAEYCYDCAPYPPNELCTSEEAEKLWKFTESETKIKYEFKKE